MPVILLMRIDFNKKMLRFFLMTLKEMLVLLGVEFNKVRFKEIELNKITKIMN